MSQQLPCFQVSSRGAFMRHDEAVSTILGEGPLVDGPGRQLAGIVQVGGPRSNVDKDDCVALALAPTDRSPNLGNLLHAEGVVRIAPVVNTGVAFDFESLAFHKNIVAIEESLRILGDMVDGVSHLPKGTDDKVLEFLADLEAALAVLGVPV